MYAIYVSLERGGLGYSGLRAGPAVSPLPPRPRKALLKQMRVPAILVALIRAAMPMVWLLRK